MNRFTFSLKINEGCFETFTTKFNEMWPQIQTFLSSTDIGNFSIWTAKDLVFGYYEADTFDNKDSINLLNNLSLTNPLSFTWISRPDEDMQLMYHDIGIVREVKDNIRHRVFMTRLKGPMEAEYKKRHDALIEKRGDLITPGPDSNFTIWSAGGYIFGYDEIDKEMEHPMTEDEKQDSIAWESKMLEIMDWITDDVDWITGDKHPHIVMLASYK